MKEETPPKTAEEIKASDFLDNNYERVFLEVNNSNNPVYNSAEVVWLLKEYASQFASTPTSKQEGEAKILRPLESITEEELNSWWQWWQDKWVDPQKCAESIKLLLSKGFDVCGLVDTASATQQEGRREEAV